MEQKELLGESVILVFRRVKEGQLSPYYLLGSVHSALRPVWVARLVGQVENVADNFVLGGEVGHHPRVEIGRAHV